MAEGSSAAIRRVREADVAAVVGLVYELAEYERLSDECQLTPGQLHQALFGPAPALFGHVAGSPARWPGMRCGS